MTYAEYIRTTILPAFLSHLTRRQEGVHPTDLWKYYKARNPEDLLVKKWADISKHGLPPDVNAQLMKDKRFQRVTFDTAGKRRLVLYFPAGRKLRIA